MEAPIRLRSLANERDDVSITHRSHADEDVVVVDFGPGADATVDVVGDTVIVVADDDQFEFPAPDDDTEITTNDGMLVLRRPRTE